MDSEKSTVLRVRSQCGSWSSRDIVPAPRHHVGPADPHAARRRRSSAYVCGIVRPQYAKAVDGAGTALDIDGYVGPLTVRALQEQLGTTRDGVISGQMEEYSGLFPNVPAMEYDGGGSEAMRAVQARIGVAHPTGIAAQATVRLLQGWLILHGYEIDSAEGGVLGESTAKALQRSINAREWL